MFVDICRTRVLVMGFTPGWLCRARCTVPVDMPRASAMSKRVTLLLMIIVGQGNLFTEFQGSKSSVNAFAPTLGQEEKNGQAICLVSPVTNAFVPAPQVAPLAR